MTILTKAITEKKFDKLDEPLVQNEVNESLPAPSKSVEIELPPHVYLSRSRARRVHTTTSICVCVTAILVLTVGVIGGIYLYRQLARAQMHRFRAWCKVPYSQDLDVFGNHYQSKQTGYPEYHDHGIEGNDAFDDTTAPLYFEEEFEIDVEYESYEEISVPDFSGGRRGRFIHDFSANKTGIIDLDGRRCFVMPLNRSLVLPPQSLFDLVLKMRAGYYEVDTEIVRETMLIVYPKITDYKSVGYYIARECASLNTYMLERLPTTRRSLTKRSVDDDDDKSIHFTEYAGKKIVHFMIVGRDIV